MLKISLTELETAKKDPVAFRAKHEDKGRGGGRSSIYMTLRNAIFEYHKTSNFTNGMNYLESHLEQFSDHAKCQKAVDHLQWYGEEYQKLNWPLIQTRVNIVIPLSTQYADSLRLSGQISRLDINPIEGYGAWLFRKEGADGWENELQMPIIQNAVGVLLGMTVKPKVVVGIVSFAERIMGFREYSEVEVAKAHIDLEAIFKQMGY